MKLLRAIGTMSGTSMDGVDVALLETDGESQLRPVADAKLSLSYSDSERDVLFAAVQEAVRIKSPSATDRPIIAQAAALSTAKHIQALQKLCTRLSEPVQLIGYHGQTVLHHPHTDPEQAYSLQLGDGAMVAQALGVPTVFDFRNADMKAGGQGAPLAPLYHKALLAGTDAMPGVVLNLGGIANITYVPDGNPENLISADIGPANVYLDDLMRLREGRAYDQDGEKASQGRVDEAAVTAFFEQSFFQADGPRSLDRYGLTPPDTASLSTQDALATLVEITVEAVARGLARLPVRPARVYVAGGGVLNTFLMARLARAVQCPVWPLDKLGFSAAYLEAEAFAYLAVRHAKGLPTSYPSTTGAKHPVIGGRLAKPAA